MRARRGDVATTLGHLGRAAVAASHSIMCDRGQWVINEKGLIDRADLGAVHERIAAVSPGEAALVSCVDEVSVLLTA